VVRSVLVDEGAALGGCHGHILGRGTGQTDHGLRLAGPAEDRR
jgi:hypothetical protein